MKDLLENPVDRLDDPKIEGRVLRALQALGTARADLEASPGTFGAALRGVRATADDEAQAEVLSRRYRQAIIDLVKADKRMLFTHADVRRAITAAQSQGDRPFFERLGKALTSGVRRDPRLARRDRLAFRVSVLLLQGLSWYEIADRLSEADDTVYDAGQLRRLLARRRGPGPRRS